MAERFAILTTASDWAAPPRTAGALTQAGAEICVVSPPGGYAAQTRYKLADIVMPIDDMFRGMPSIARALAEDFGAYAILAGDDLAFAALAKLVERMDGLPLSDTTRALVLRSMPPLAAAKLLASDSAFIVAQQNDEPCPAPPCIANPDLAEASAFVALHGFPLVVKRDGFASGHGVTICRSEADLRAAMARTTGEARNATFVLQKFIAGTVYGATVCGAHGRALAGFSFVKHQCSTENGATSVARHDDRPEILQSSFALFERYGLFGFSGFDYIVEPSGRTYLIEINPRLMPTGHITQFGVDLCATFLSAVRGQKPPPPPSRTHEYVALFPNEWARDSESQHLRTTFHDVPWHDPPLLAVMIDRTLAAQTPLERTSWTIKY